MRRATSVTRGVYLISLRKRLAEATSASTDWNEFAIGHFLIDTSNLGIVPHSLVGRLAFFSLNKENR